MRASVLAATALVVASIILFELTQDPTGPDRLRLLAVVAGAGILALGLRWLLDRVSGRLRSLPLLLGVPAIGSLVVVAAAVTLAAAGMVLDTPQLPVVFVAIGLGAGLAILATAVVARRAVADLGAVVDVAVRVGDGELGRRTGVDRADEIGDLARAVDRMVDRLEVAAATREADQAARREFLASVGHDLRTPLTAITVAAEALADGVVDDPDRYLATIVAQAATMERLVADVTTLTTLDAGGVSATPTDVVELVDETIEAMGPIADGRGVALVGDVDGAPIWPLDAHAMGRMLRNLVHNAVKHAPVGSIVTVSGRVVDGELVVSVHDEGPGFPPDLAERAFDRFVTGDPARRAEGFGLGLTIARSVAEAHGGRIGIGPGPGGTVVAHLPGRPPTPVGP
ncbi:MAG: HAMP domain-containing sensor histidine kinase [Acidimicrobiia bacterium]